MTTIWSSPTSTLHPRHTLSFPLEFITFPGDCVVSIVVLIVKLTEVIFNDNEHENSIRFGTERVR